jgi:hypothetical protein
LRGGRRQRQGILVKVGRIADPHVDLLRVVLRELTQKANKCIIEKEEFTERAKRIHIGGQQMTLLVEVSPLVVADPPS